MIYIPWVKAKTCVSLSAAVSVPVECPRRSRSHIGATLGGQDPLGASEAALRLRGPSWCLQLSGVTDGHGCAARLGGRRNRRSGVGVGGGRALMEPTP